MKKVVKIAAWLMLSLIILFFILFAPVNDKPPEKHSFYRRNIDTVDSLTIQVYKTDKSIHVAWGEVNITPANFIPMAGYRPRDAFETVHDSLFAKVFLIDNGKAKFAIVSIDLLLFPPALKHKLISYKNDLALTDYYFSATHTHNGFGCWNNSFAGELISGTYNESLLYNISLKIFKS
ncbi:MAG: hypothetical protein MUF68_05105 [Cyclobacteriaceae bacterium]|nr:hypothetical protein [Cyclobacteriaceae bacterium]